MLWREVKTWARQNGYDVLKEKGEEVYLWTKENDPLVSGIAYSVKNLAIEIYNHITDNKWLQYQKDYQENKTFHISSENS